LARNRVYFSPFYVDRPTQISGGFIAQYGASSTIGSIIRAGLFKLGTANGNHWNAGATIDIRFSGAANYLFKSNAMAEIENGYSTAWPSNPVSDSLSVYSYGYLPFIPKWKHWDA